MPGFGIPILAYSDEILTGKFYDGVLQSQLIA